MIRMTIAHLGLDRSTQSPVVVLREDGGERTLPIWIGAPEANAIAMELKGEKPARPMTHDLLKQLLLGLGGQLQRVTITQLRENTYLAELLVHRGDQLFEIDARPSDSIALALRTQAPIFANEELLDRGSSSEPSGGSPDADPDALKKFLSKLDPQDLGRFQP
jgi:uncharacterized protein